MEIHGTSIDGNARRRARTRTAIIESARQFIAEGNPDPSVQAITERAEVGFGSFFNHFASKDELFRAALEDAFMRADKLSGDPVAHIEDPLIRMTMQMRLFGRLPEIDYPTARILAFSPTDTFGIDSGYNLNFEAVVLLAKESGRLPRPRDSMITQTFIWGAVKHLLLLRCTDANHPMSWVDDFVEIALTLYGIDQGLAYELAHSPLPDISTFQEWELS
jgi:AcrR family transcriptional regulator